MKFSKELLITYIYKHCGLAREDIYDLLKCLPEVIEIEQDNKIEELEIKEWTIIKILKKLNEIIKFINEN